MKKYAETNINNEILKVMDEKKFTWDSAMSVDTIKILFEGISKYLGHVKEKNVVHAVSLESVNGDFKLGAFTEFIKGESDGDDSYVLTFTFNKDDLKKEYETVLLSDPILKSIIADVAIEYGITFKVINGKLFLLEAMCIMVDSIRNYMHANVTIDPGVELENYFKASAELDGDKVYYKITPGEILKQHVKDDARNEKKSEM